MSFAFSAAGTIDGAKAQIRAVEDHYSNDTSQLEAVKLFILSELEKWPENPHASNGVLIEASGHHDHLSRSLNISMRPLQLRFADQTAAQEGGTA